MLLYLKFIILFIASVSFCYNTEILIIYSVAERSFLPCSSEIITEHLCLSIYPHKYPKFW